MEQKTKDKIKNYGSALLPGIVAAVLLSQSQIMALIPPSETLIYGGAIIFFTVLSTYYSKQHVQNAKARGIEKGIAQCATGAQEIVEALDTEVSEEDIA